MSCKAVIGTCQCLTVKARCVFFSWWLGGDLPADATSCYAIDAQHLKSLKKRGHIGLQLLFPSRTKQFRENVPALAEARVL